MDFKIAKSPEFLVWTIEPAISENLGTEIRGLTVREISKFEEIIHTGQY
jgi:hypothetical protein